jgi:hypothetical protein
MRRSTGVFATLALVLALGSVDTLAADERSPILVGADGRVEIPAASFALAFPSDWDIDVSASGLADVSFAVVTGHSPESDVTCELFMYGPCSGEPFGDCADALDEIAARMIATYESSEDFEGMVEQTPVATAAVHAIWMDIEWAEDEDAAFGTTYLLTDGSVFDYLLCRGSERPDDRWLSIAETIEWLPAEE